MYILIATTVLGQRDLYRPPANGQPQAQERAIYDYNDYEDYSPRQVEPGVSATTADPEGINCLIIIQILLIIQQLYVFPSNDG